MVGPMKFQSHRVCCLHLERRTGHMQNESLMKKETDCVQKMKANREAERRKEEEIVKQKE